jgi:hypothetical protein
MAAGGIGAAVSDSGTEPVETATSGRPSSVLGTAPPTGAGVSPSAWGKATPVAGVGLPGTCGTAPAKGAGISISGGTSPAVWTGVPDACGAARGGVPATWGGKSAVGAIAPAASSSRSPVNWPACCVGARETSLTPGLLSPVGVVADGAPGCGAGPAVGVVADGPSGFAASGASTPSKSSAPGTDGSMSPMAAGSAAWAGPGVGPMGGWPIGAMGTSVPCWGVASGIAGGV